MMKYLSILLAMFMPCMARAFVSNYYDTNATPVVDAHVQTLTVAKAITAGTANSLTNFGLSHFLYVDNSGTNPGVVGDFTHPWKTLAALQTATNGDTVQVGYGIITNMPGGKTVISNGVSLYGKGMYLTIVPSVSAQQSNVIANLKTLKISSPGFAPFGHDIILESVQVGDLTSIDATAFVNATNLTINNSIFWGNWDIDAGLIGSIWNNDQITLSDASPPGTSLSGMHAHNVTLDNGTLTSVGGVVNIASTQSTNYYDSGGANIHNAMVAFISGTPTNISVRIYGTVFNHTQANGSPPISAFYNPNGCTNVFGWYWDNGVLTYVNGTNIYQPYANYIFSGNGSGLTNLNIVGSGGLTNAPFGLVTNKAAADVVVTNAGVATIIASNSVTTGNLLLSGTNIVFTGAHSFIQYPASGYAQGDITIQTSPGYPIGVRFSTTDGSASGNIDFFENVGNVGAVHVFSLTTVNSLGVFAGIGMQTATNTFQVSQITGKPTTVQIGGNGQPSYFRVVGGNATIDGTNTAGTLIASGSVIATNGVASYASNTLALASIVFPTTTVNWTNTFGKNIFIFIDNAGVTGTALKINGTQISSTLVVTGDTMLPLQPGDYFSETYTVGTPAAVWKPQ